MYLSSNSLHLPEQQPKTKINNIITSITATRSKEKDGISVILTVDEDCLKVLESLQQLRITRLHHTLEVTPPTDLSRRKK